MSRITTITTIKKLEERYPFTEEELEVIARWHDQLQDIRCDNDFLMTMTRALPYSVFFLPGDELGDRVRWLEETLLPKDFSRRLLGAIYSDAFIDYANQGEDRSLERLVEGIADTGRRGSSEALRVTYSMLAEDPTAEGLVGLCIALAVASEALITPTLDKELVKGRMEDARPCILSMARSLSEFCSPSGLDQQAFVSWAERNFPGLASPLATFIHNILFHGRPFPKARVPYIAPNVLGSSAILETSTSPFLLCLSFAHHNLGGKWQRLYSSEVDGRSFNRLEWSLLGYTGPTIMLIKTTSAAVLGAYANFEWKESLTFRGNSDSFLFQLKPRLALYRPEGHETNFAFLRAQRKSALRPSDASGARYGLGFGGNSDKPRLFIPESFEKCQATFYDKTYRVGELLPEDSLETFEIASMECWGVGGEETIQGALKYQAVYRKHHQEMIVGARVVHDKTPFAKDLQSGLIPSSLYKHQEQVRGRADFIVDDEHDGAYKIDRDY